MGDFHSLSHFITTRHQSHGTRGEIPFISPYQWDTEGLTVKIRPQIQKAAKWRSDAVPSGSKCITFWCLHATLGEGGQQSVIVSKESCNGKIYIYFTSSLLTHQPFVYKVTPCCHTHIPNTASHPRPHALTDRIKDWEGLDRVPPILKFLAFFVPWTHFCSLMKLLNFF